MTDQHPIKLSDPNVQALLLEGKFTFLSMAQAMIGAEFSLSAWPSETIGHAIAAKAAGCDIEVVIRGSASGAAHVLLVAVEPGGARHELGRVSEPEPTAAN